MSHYAVAVFSDDGFFDYLLAPYNENDRKYFEFVPVAYANIVAEFERFQKENRSWTLDMYIEEMRYIQKDGQWGYEHNPHGYWDWYSLDGRDYMFDLKEDADIEEDQYDYRKNDYNWYPEDPDEVSESAEFWDMYIEGGKEEGYPSFYSREYYFERYGTKEQYLKEMSRVVPYAFITPDGVWHSPGRVGYFGSSNETKEDWNRYIKEWDEWIASDANPFVNFVDCHI